MRVSDKSVGAFATTLHIHALCEPQAHPLVDLKSVTLSVSPSAVVGIVRKKSPHGWCHSSARSPWAHVHMVLHAVPFHALGPGQPAAQTHAMQTPRKTYQQAAAHGVLTQWGWG